MNEVSDNLQDAIENAIPDAIMAAMQKACLIIETDAKKNCPVDDGTLRQSISHNIEKTDSGCTGTVGTDCEYAPYICKGTGIYNKDGQGRQTAWKYQDAKGEWHTTKGMKAQPFLQPALDNNKSEIEKCFERII